MADMQSPAAKPLANAAQGVATGLTASSSVKLPPAMPGMAGAAAAVAAVGLASAKLPKPA